MTIHLLMVCGLGVAMTEPRSCDRGGLAENIYYLALGSEFVRVLSNDRNALVTDGASRVPGPVHHRVCTAG